MFTIEAKPIQPASAREALLNEATGAYVSFEGWVRARNEGRDVIALEYEAAATLAGNEFTKIETETLKQFDITAVHCIHRTGRLDIGELAVWIGVTAPHRDAAFRACRFVIDELKQRLPIWKKEHYTDGESDWLNHP